MAIGRAGYTITDEAAYFQLDDPVGTYPARFILLVTRVREGRRGVIPATTHVDGTGRVQVVVRDANPPITG